MQYCEPEKLSGHDLVNYLIANPEARGNFKYSSFRSCMWRNLLIAQPGFADVADFDKIYHHDIYKILLEQPQLAPYFDFSKLWDGENRWLFIKRPEIATPETTAYLYAETWGAILKKHPKLAYLFPWEKFYFFEWKWVVGAQSSCLQYLKMEYIKSAQALYTVLYYCYLGSCHSYKGVFEQGVSDVSSYLILKRMDRVNGKHFLKNQIQDENWVFIDELSAISPKDVLDVYYKKYICFFMTLVAPDSVFEKLFPFFDLNARDPGGNSHLFAALVHGMISNDFNRYNTLLQLGFDPDEKNLAGFSCNDFLMHIESMDVVDSILEKHPFLRGEEGMINIYKKILEKEGSLDNIPKKAKDAAFAFVNSCLGEGNELSRKNFDLLFERELEEFVNGLEK